jgi:hypothetical protein
MAKLDRVLVSVEWDSRYPMTRMSMLPKQVSDHNPLLISFGARLPVMELVFRFEKWWLEMDNFADLVQKVWKTESPYANAIDVWQFKIRLLRKKAKGWSKNREAKIRRSEANIILELDMLDKLFEQQNLTTHEINVRKELSAELEQI